MGKTKILIIDDEKYVREMIQLRVEEEGYDVTIAVDGIMGVNKAIALKPDLILMDLMMEGITGIEAISKIRDHEDTKEIPILVLTGKTLDQDKEEAKKAGASGFISKPILPHRLIQEIKKYVGS